MNIKAAFKYQFNDHKKSLAIFYFTILCVYTMIWIIMIKASKGEPTVSGSFGGMDIATAIFMFVTGLCSFKENFLMLSQNGISRKTILISRILANISLVFIMAFIDNIIAVIFGALTSSMSNNIKYQQLFSQVFVGMDDGISGMMLFIKSFAIDFAVYFGVIFIGYFITILFYRLNKAGKIIVGVGVPVFLNIGLPIIDGISDGKLGNIIGKCTQFLTGTLSSAITSFIVFGLVFGIFSCLLIRRAVVRS